LRPGPQLLPRQVGFFQGILPRAPYPGGGVVLEQVGTEPIQDSGSAARSGGGNGGQPIGGGSGGGSGGGADLLRGGRDEGKWALVRASEHGGISRSSGRVGGPRLCEPPTGGTAEFTKSSGVIESSFADHTSGAQRRGLRAIELASGSGLRGVETASHLGQGRGESAGRRIEG